MNHDCPICRSPARVRPLMRKNGWPLHRCLDCDHIFVAPMPTQDALDGIYSFAAGYQKQPMVRFSESDAAPAKLAERLDLIARHAPDGALLDVGCSSGRFLFLARQRGYAVQGVELNPDTAAIARANGLPVTVGDLQHAELPPASFDVVQLGDVVEHVRDPADLLTRVRALLKPRGVVLVVTPNHDAFFPRATHALYRATGIPWSHATPPHHLHQFSLKSLTTLLERTGLGVVEARFGSCSLAYELRSTGLFGPLREALVRRQIGAALLRAGACAAATIAYSAIFAADRALFRKRRDFDMRVVASAR